MAGSVLGNRVVRKEDPKFITTGGVYLDDLAVLDGAEELAGAAHVAYIRSTVAHGVVTGIDTSEATGIPGVVGIYTAADLGLEPSASQFNPEVARPLLASERVRFVGEPVAAVVAETATAAADAAAAVFVDYDVLESYTDPEAAAAGSTLLYEEVGSNVVFDSAALGMPGLTDDFLAECEVVAEGRFVNQRVAPCPLEVRASAVNWVDGRLFQWLSTQHAQGNRDAIAAANGVDAEQVRIITPDVGGGFGAKISVYADELLLGRIAKAAGRPVRWIETRSESMMALGHGRGQVQYVKIGGQRDGTVTHYQLKVIQDCGGFMEVGAVLAPFMTRPMSSGVYDIANIECHTLSVLTNTTPTVAYRGAGRPEATAAIERAMDLFAADVGLDPAEVRRRNLIAPFDEPHTTSIDQTYDVGDYPRALEGALAAAGYDELRAEQARRRDAGENNQLGIGVSVYVEITGGIAPFGEEAKIEIGADGTATVFTGVSPHGQGHDTSFSMIASERTGIPMDQITLVWGDTDQVPKGLGTMGSRSLQQGGAAVDKAAGELVDLAVELAANELEADAADVVLDVERGVFHVTGTPAVGKTWADLAAAHASASAGASAPGDVAPADDESVDAWPVDGLGVATRFDAVSPTFPFGSHVSVVEVDTETGHVRLLRHVSVDDAGRILNPLLLEGQIHGGIAQGAAQALLEEVRYDDDGNPVTSNLADYAMISAAELPSFEAAPMETPTPVNPLGAKGIGESGTIGATPAVQSAVIDALAHLGVRHVDMPATPERIWRAIQEAERPPIPQPAGEGSAGDEPDAVPERHRQQHGAAR